MASSNLDGDLSVAQLDDNGTSGTGESDNGSEVARSNKESYLLCPKGLRKVLDTVIHPDISGVTLALVVTEDGDNLYHSTGTSTNDANLHAGIAFAIWQTHRNAMDRAMADSKNELGDVGDIKLILTE
jgi:hypothetical protein